KRLEILQSIFGCDVEKRQAELDREAEKLRRKVSHNEYFYDIDGRATVEFMHGHTDLDMLNRLGTAITLSYEVARLRKGGAISAAPFNVALSELQPDALVFDVSTPARIAKARAFCEHF